MIHGFSGWDQDKTEPVSAADNRSSCDAETYATRKGLAAKKKAYGALLGWSLSLTFPFI